jgi:hypothetical protein
MTLEERTAPRRKRIVAHVASSYDQAEAVWRSGSKIDDPGARRRDDGRLLGDVKRHRGG